MTALQYNYTSNNVPGAYYGALPELPVVQVATPGEFEFSWNATQDELNTTGSWDMLWTVYFNSPDHSSVYPSDTGYQYRESGYSGDLLGNNPPPTNGLTTMPIALNATISYWTAGDSLVFQLIELEEDGRTPTGRRVFSQNMTLVANETNPATTTLGYSEQYASMTSEYPAFASRSASTTSSRLPPDTTYTQWTAQAAVTGSGSAGTATSSGATSTATQGNAGERVKTSGSLWRAGLALTLVSLVFSSL